MKIRSGFVSNSSSSSFVCDVCGEVESGMDASLSDFDMVEFACGHLMCTHHVPTEVTTLEEWDEAFDEEGGHEMPEKWCPICSLKYIEDATLLRYLCRKYGIGIEEVKKQIRKEYTNMDELNKFIGEE